VRAVTRTHQAGFQAIFAVGPFRALFISRSLMIVSETMKALALSMLVFERTGSALQAAMAYMAGVLAYLLGGTLLLSLADTFSARLILSGYHLFRLGIIGLLAFVVLPVPIVLLLAAITGVFGPVAEGSAASLLSNVLSERTYVSGRALFTASVGAAQMVGHGIGGLLFIALNPYGVLTIAAVICLAGVGVSWLGLRNCDDRPRKRDLPVTNAPGASLPSRGLRLSAATATWRINKALVANRRVRSLLLAQLVPCSLAVGAEGAVVPFTADMGRSSAGLMFTAMTSGMLVGTILTGRFAAGGRSERLVPPLVYLTGSGLLLFALSPGLIIAVTLIGISSVGLSYGTGLQERFLKALPDNARGQAFGLLSTSMLTGQALAIFAAGGLAVILDAGLVIAVLGFLVIAAGLMLRPHLRSDSRPRSPNGRQMARAAQDDSAMIAP
jgi:MFS family permease